MPIALRKNHGITGDQLHRRLAVHLGVTLPFGDEVKDDDDQRAKPIHDALARLCSTANFDVIRQQRIASTLDYVDAEGACDAAFVGGPVALAWSRFDDAVRARYLQAIDQWREGRGYRLPVEFVVVSAAVHP